MAEGAIDMCATLVPFLCLTILFVYNQTMAEKTKYKLLEVGVEDYDLHSYPIPHTVSPAELRESLQFLSSVVPPDGSFQVQLKDPSEMSIKELKGAIRKAGLGNKAVGLMEKQEFVKLLQDHRDGKL